LLSDEEDPDSDLEDYYPGVKLEKLSVNYEEFNLAKAERRKAKIEVQDWVRNFKKENGRSPNDSDTSAIALELADFNGTDQKYITIKLKLILENELPF
jgi:hypothetical protein